jgi:hypothetical protein
MGLSKSKFSCGSTAGTTGLEPSVMVQARPNTVYSLEFSADLVRWSRRNTVKKRHVDAARGILGDPWFWTDWLESTMRDATEEMLGDLFEVGVNAHGAPPVLDIHVELDPPPKRTRRNPQGHNEITGVVTWRSIPASEVSMENAIDWRLGDRLSMYGIQSETDGWSCYFHPGTLTIS